MLDTLKGVRFDINKFLIYSIDNKDNMVPFKIHNNFKTKDRIKYMTEYNMIKNKEIYRN